MESVQSRKHWPAEVEADCSGFQYVATRLMVVFFKRIENILFMTFLKE